MRLSILLSLTLSLLTSCSTPEPVKPVEEAAPACDLSLDNLDGKMFLHKEKGADGKTWEDDVLARVKFYKEGDKLKAKYNTRSATDMYSYTCVKAQDGKQLDCWEDNPSAADYCRTIIVNNMEGGCTPEAIIKLTHLPQDKAEEGYKEVMAELKKLPPKEVEDMKKVFNSENNQLRGIFHVKLAKGAECQLTLTDNFETYAYGQRRELSNVLGSGRFAQTDRELVWEHCKESENLVALTAPDGWAKPGETLHSFKAGQPIPFRYVGDQDIKPQPGCTYTMDTWSQYAPETKGAPVETDDKGRLKWQFTETYPKAGKYVVHIYRYKACNGGQPELLPVSCQGFRIE